MLGHTWWGCVAAVISTLAVPTPVGADDFAACASIRYGGPHDCHGLARVLDTCFAQHECFPTYQGEVAGYGSMTATCDDQGDVVNVTFYDDAKCTKHSDFHLVESDHCLPTRFGPTYFACEHGSVVGSGWVPRDVLQLYSDVSARARSATGMFLFLSMTFFLLLSFRAARIRRLAQQREAYRVLPSRFVSRADSDSEFSDTETTATTRTTTRPPAYSTAPTGGFARVLPPPSYSSGAATAAAVEQELPQEAPPNYEEAAVMGEGAAPASSAASQSLSASSDA
eukprot:m.481099 g.481099  ORF g.481099 m.481099 type:complete len:282 (-) comp22045_c0_seq1:24-869(-)